MRNIIANGAKGFFLGLKSTFTYWSILLFIVQIKRIISGRYCGIRISKVFEEKIL